MMYLKIGIRNGEPIYVKTRDAEELMRLFRRCVKMNEEYFDIKDSTGLSIIVKVSAITSMQTCFND